MSDVHRDQLLLALGLVQAAADALMNAETRIEANTASHPDTALEHAVLEARDTTNTLRRILARKAGV